jgi:hypothetical protein
VAHQPSAGAAGRGQDAVVGTEAVVLAALIADPIPAKSVAAAATTSGVAITNDISSATNYR